MTGGSRAAVIANDPMALARFMRRKQDWRTVLLDWGFWADPRQLPPAGDWRTWLLIAGRGFGKTRAGAEWVRSLAERNGKLRIALVAANRDEARRVMIEGESGLLRIAPGATRPKWEPARGRLLWRSGAQAFVYSGENPEGLRGPQHDYAWCDELAKWAYPQGTWDNLRLGLRVGAAPRALVTTTPRPIALLKALMTAPGTVAVRGRTADNPYLPGRFVDQVTADYGGTRLGRQELDGELIEDAEGALWTRAMLEACRVPAGERALDDASRIVVGVDPPAGTEGTCGIVAVARLRDGTGLVLEDASVVRASPESWARAVAACAARHGTDRVIAEANQGGAMVKSVLLAADARLPVTLVHASRGKAARAEPVAALYERALVRHPRAFPALEDELCGLLAGGGYDGPGRSPDRADALVWAVTALMLGGRGEAGVRVL